MAPQVQSSCHKLSCKIVIICVCASIPITFHYIVAANICSDKNVQGYNLALKTTSLTLNQLGDTKITAYQHLQSSNRPDESADFRGYGIATLEKRLRLDRLATEVDLDLVGCIPIIHPDFHGPPRKDDPRPAIIVESIKDQSSPQPIQVWQGWTAPAKLASATFLALAFGLTCCLLPLRSRKSVSSLEPPQIQRKVSSGRFNKTSHSCLSRKASQDIIRVPSHCRKLAMEKPSKAGQSVELDEQNSQ